MNLFNQLTSYLDAHFNGIKLKQPLFFSGIPGLRFDLQDEKTDTANDAYFDEVVKRMGEIHAVTISPGDDILILYQTYTFKRRKIRKYNYLFKQFDASTASIQSKGIKPSFTRMGHIVRETNLVRSSLVIKQQTLTSVISI